MQLKILKISTIDREGMTSKTGNKDTVINAVHNNNLMSCNNIRPDVSFKRQINVQRRSLSVKHKCPLSVSVILLILFVVLYKLSAWNQLII